MMIDVLESVSVDSITPCGDDPSKIAVKFSMKGNLDFEEVRTHSDVFDEVKISSELGVVNGMIKGYRILLFSGGTGMLRLVDNIDVAKQLIRKIMGFYSTG